MKTDEKSLPALFKKSLAAIQDTALFLKERMTSAHAYTKVSFFVSSMSIRYKIAAALIAILALAIASLGAITFSHQKKSLQEEMRKRAAALVQYLASVGKEGLLTNEELGVYSTIKDIQSNSGVIYAMITDSKGKVFVHNHLSEKGKILSGEADQNSLKAEALLFQETDLDGEPILDAALPIVTKAQKLKIGIARVGLSQRDLQKTISRQKAVYSWISLGFVAVGLLISFALARVLTQPIYTLAVGMQVVSEGDLSHLVKVFYKDEIGRLTETFNQMILSLREKLHMEKYLSFSTLKSIKRTRDTAQLKLGGERKYITALFSDVRGFTAMSEKMSPEEVVSILNIYLNLQEKVVRHRDGIVDKYVGDEVMAIFEGPGQEINAVRAALEIQRYCQSLNWSRAKLDKKQMKVGIGLHSGDVVMGNLGSEQQMNYTVIGDNVNTAARLCSAAQQGQVVISKSVADKVKKEAKLKALEPVMVKGKEKSIEIYEVLDCSGVTRKFMRRGVELEAVYQLAGLTEESIRATARNISPGGCLLELATPVGIGSKLDLHINSESLQQIRDLKGIVRHARKYESKYYVGVSFEGLPEKSKDEIGEWVHEVESEIVRSLPA